MRRAINWCVKQKKWHHCNWKTNERPDRQKRYIDVLSIVQTPALNRCTALIHLSVSLYGACFNLYLPSLRHISGSILLHIFISSSFISPAAVLSTMTLPPLCIASILHLNPLSAPLLSFFCWLALSLNPPILTSSYPVSVVLSETALSGGSFTKYKYTHMSFHCRLICSGPNADNLA